VQHRHEQVVHGLVVARVVQAMAARAGHGVPIQRARVAHEDGRALLTRDASRYRTLLPALALISP